MKLTKNVYLKLAEAQNQLRLAELNLKGEVKNVNILEQVPGGIYQLKVNNRNTRARCEICSKLTIKTLERRHWRRSGIFIVNFEHISHLL